MSGNRARDIISGRRELPFDLLDRTTEKPELVEKAEAADKEHVMEDVVPRSSTLSYLTAEKFGTQWLDDGDFIDAPSALRDNFAECYKRFGKVPQKVGRNTNLLAGTDQFPASPQSERIIESDAHHGVPTFPPADRAIEHLVLLAGKGPDPIVANAK